MRRTVLALLFIVALVAVACGGDDSGDAADGATDADSTEASDQVGDPVADEEGAGDADGQTGGDAESTVSGAGPQIGDHWHAAYGIYVCDSFVSPIPDDNDPEGIHTHGDGVIHIHPFLDSAAGDRATLGKFFEALDVTLSDEGFFGPGGSLEESDLDCNGEPVELKVARWHLSGTDAAPAVVESDLAEIRFLEDLEIYTLAFVPAGADIPLPDSIGALGSISDVDPEDVPELPPGFAVAVVEPPGPGATVAGETPCPAVDGSSPRTTRFERRPPMCIDPSATYTATFVTNYGDVVVELDTENTPETVNNFVVLARYHYYDGTALFRTAPSIAIIQGGSPHSNGGGDQGPGYTIADEGDGYSYSVGDLAMARTPAPDSASAQFFFSAGPETALLDGPPGNANGDGTGTYVRFGRTIEGIEVLEEILSLHVDDARLNGGGPGQPVIVETVLIEES